MKDKIIFHIKKTTIIIMWLIVSVVICALIAKNLLGTIDVRGEESLTLAGTIITLTISIFGGIYLYLKIQYKK